MGIFFISIILTSTSSLLAKTVSVNVYLKVSASTPIASLIQDFNYFLQQDPTLASYNIKPFQKTYPLHVTLYLADYQAPQLPKILQLTAHVARQQKKMTLWTKAFKVNKHGYMMLVLKSDDQLMRLSNALISLLAPLHDKHAIIPIWAVNDAAKKALFRRYGSPNVGSQFTPHISIFDAESAKPVLYHQLQALIIQFTLKHPMQVSALSHTIGIGIANSQGQIIKELASFSLY